MSTVAITAETAAARFRHRPWLPVALLVLLPFVAHLPQWLLPVHGDPIWQFAFLSYGARHTQLPGQAFLDPNIGFTSQAFKRLIARDWLHGAGYVSAAFLALALAVVILTRPRVATKLS